MTKGTIRINDFESAKGSIHGLLFAQKILNHRYTRVGVRVLVSVQVRIKIREFELEIENAHRVPNE